MQHNPFLSKPPGGRRHDRNERNVVRRLEQALAEVRSLEKKEILFKLFLFRNVRNTQHYNVKKMKKFLYY